MKKALTALDYVHTMKGKGDGGGGGGGGRGERTVGLDVEASRFLIRQVTCYQRVELD